MLKSMFSIYVQQPFICEKEHLKQLFPHLQTMLVTANIFPTIHPSSSM